MSLGSRLEWPPVSQDLAAAPAVTLTMVQISQPFSGALPPAPATPVTRDWAALAIFGVWACGFIALSADCVFEAGAASGPRYAPALRLTFQAPSRFALRRACSNPESSGCSAPFFLLPAGIAGTLAAASIGGGACARDVPRPAARQLNFRDPHDRRGGLLVSSAGMVDRRAAGRRTRASLRRSGAEL